MSWHPGRHRLELTSQVNGGNLSNVFGHNQSKAQCFQGRILKYPLRT